MERFIEAMRSRGDEERAQWAGEALSAEKARMGNAIPHLQSICSALEDEGHAAVVIKSLDHWPDLGSDLDMFTTATPETVLELMKRRFHARLAPRSWGDRLARKWNFLIPGLPEAVEIHVGRLGQTGEQTVLASFVARRARTVSIDGRSFRVPHVSDRLMISTLQRMYRHFYFRLCDIVDSAGLIESGAIDDRRRLCEPIPRRRSSFAGVGDIDGSFWGREDFLREGISARADSAAVGGTLQLATGRSVAQGGTGEHDAAWVTAGAGGSGARGAENYGQRQGDLVVDSTRILLLCFLRPGSHRGVFLWVTSWLGRRDRSRASLT
jgi:hypothetical protein